jgi:hypothetical protein
MFALVVKKFEGKKLPGSAGGTVHPHVECTFLSKNWRPPKINCIKKYCSGKKGNKKTIR